MVFKVSHYVNLEVNREYLASRNISLVSMGPSATRSVKLHITETSASFTAIIVFSLQYLIVVGMASGIVLLLVIWQRSRPQLADRTDIDNIEGNTEGVNEQLIANKQAIIRESEENDLALDVKDDGFGYRPSHIIVDKAIDLQEVPKSTENHEFNEEDSMDDDDPK